MANRPPARERLDGYRALVSRAVPLADILADTAGMHLEVTGPGEPEIICSLPVTCPADNRELIRRHIEIPADLIGMLDAAARRDAERRREIERLRQALEAKGGKPAKDYAAECAMKCAEPAFMRFLIERHDPAASGDRQDGRDARAVRAGDHKPQPIEHRSRRRSAMAENGEGL
ncbi:hypothetical protein [Martelella soudanensis]|uniref:hypothetical protein n=1 Tax=unclassified Martelella TaxID=2629616 RepID=UPI0015DDF3FC|nr:MULTISPECIES: hypothetical protein [unclassified Martelella]